MATPETCNTGRVGLTRFAYFPGEGVYISLENATNEEEARGGAQQGGEDNDRPRRLRPAKEEEQSYTTRQYPLWKKDSIYEKYDDRRAIEASPIIPSFRFDNSARFLQEQQHNETTEYLYGRHCYCAPVDDVYCPVGVELCRIVRPTPDSFRVQCEGDVQGLFARFLLPLVIFMFLFLTCLVVSSPQGRYARGYLRKIVQRWSEERYQQALRQEIDGMMARTQRIRERLAHRSPRRVYYTSATDPLTLMNTATLMSRRRGNRSNASGATALEELELANTAAGVIQGAPLPPVQVPVRLATRLYGTKESADEGVTECTICLAEFRDGDRVGNLHCGHVFHVDPCLKRWLVRRNHCPLCQAPAVIALAPPPPPANETATRREENEIAVQQETDDNESNSRLAITGQSESAEHPINDVAGPESV